MPNLNTILTIIFAAIAIVGVCCVVFQIYQMTVIDATARGFKHPKLWGVFTSGDNHFNGLLIYFIIRKKFPIMNISEDHIKNWKNTKNQQVLD